MKLLSFLALFFGFLGATFLITALLNSLAPTPNFSTTFLVVAGLCFCSFPVGFTAARFLMKPRPRTVS